MTAVVFAGPSIYGLDLAAFAPCSFRPPAAAGDVLAAIEEGATAIGLIDGLYGDCAAVWHKEILYGLSKGIAIAGAASMGALRAAECDPFGMVGFGAVFADYRSGRRTADADVAVSHAPGELGYRPSTVALVEVEATIAALRSELGETLAERLTAAAASLHFSERRWRAVVATAGAAPELAGRLAQATVPVKQADALLLLNGLSRLAPPAADQARRWTFQDTLFFRSLKGRYHHRQDP